MSLTEKEEVGSSSSVQSSNGDEERKKETRKKLTLPEQRVERVELLFELVRRQVNEFIALDCEYERN